MGIFSLAKRTSSLGKVVDLNAVNKGDEVSVVIDGDSLVYWVFTEAIFALGPDFWVAGGQYDTLHTIITQLVKAFAKRNILLHVIFDGPVVSYEKELTFKTRRSTEIRAVSSVWRTLRNSIPLQAGCPAIPHLSKMQIYWTLKSLGVPTYVALSEGDRDVAQYCFSRPKLLYGVISQDSDYLVYKIPNYIPFNSLKFHSSSLVCKVISPKEVSENYGIHVDLLPVWACMLGNDYFDRIASLGIVGSSQFLEKACHSKNLHLSQREIEEIVTAVANNFASGHEKEGFKRKLFAALMQYYYASNLTVGENVISLYEAEECYLSKCTRRLPPKTPETETTPVSDSNAVCASPEGKNVPSEVNILPQAPSECTVHSQVVESTSKDQTPPTTVSDSAASQSTVTSAPVISPSKSKKKKSKKKKSNMDFSSHIDTKQHAPHMLNVPHEILEVLPNTIYLRRTVEAACFQRVFCRVLNHSEHSRVPSPWLLTRPIRKRLYGVLLPPTGKPVVEWSQDASVEYSSASVHPYKEVHGTPLPPIGDILVLQPTDSKRFSLFWLLMGVKSPNVSIPGPLDNVWLLCVCSVLVCAISSLSQPLLSEWEFDALVSYFVSLHESPEPSIPITNLLVHFMGDYQQNDTNPTTLEVVRPPHLNAPLNNSDDTSNQHYHHNPPSRRHKKTSTIPVVQPPYLSYCLTGTYLPLHKKYSQRDQHPTRTVLTRAVHLLNVVQVLCDQCLEIIQLCWAPTVVPGMPGPHQLINGLAWQKSYQERLLAHSLGTEAELPLSAAARNIKNLVLSCIPQAPVFLRYSSSDYDTTTTTASTSTSTSTTATTSDEDSTTIQEQEPQPSKPEAEETNQPQLGETPPADHSPEEP
ncbi:hypothetical protein Pelo_10664 [Pelomyxa schiedti]|nr:hypothetical protein Pelo_10664 [Pelomyxa schiedti]